MDPGHELDCVNSEALVAHPFSQDKPELRDDSTVALELGVECPVLGAHRYTSSIRQGHASVPIELMLSHVDGLLKGRERVEELLLDLATCLRRLANDLADLSIASSIEEAVDESLSVVPSGQASCLLVSGVDITVKDLLCVRSLVEVVHHLS